MSLGMAAMMGEEQTEETEDFEKLYLSLVNNPVISDYLFAEGRLFHLISDVEEVFSKKLELWQMPEVVENYEPDSLLNYPSFLIKIKYLGDEKNETKKDDQTKSSRL